MDILHSLVLGVIEGITEFLPISSTAHLILGAELLRIPSSDFSKSFEVIIQLGAILAVVSLYYKKLFQIKTIKKLIVAFIPTAIIGLVFYKIIKNIFFENLNIIVGALIIGGILLIVLEKFFKNREAKQLPTTEISYQKSFLIGIFQSLAIIPGVSRAAATIIGGLALGLKREAIVEFSFLLAVPTMLAASALDLFKVGNSFSSNEILVLIIGFGTAFGVALLSIKLLLKYIQKYDFQPFGVYRIIIGLICFWLLI